MFHYFVRDMALGGEPDRMTPGVIVSRLIGASVAVSLVGGTSIFAIMLVGKALAWAGAGVAGFWFAGWMFGIPALKRRFREEPMARIALDTIHNVLVWTIPLQAVLLTTLSLIAASIMLGDGGGYGTPTENIYEFITMSVFVFAFVLSFGGLAYLGYAMIVGNVGSGGLGWKLLGWLLVLAAIAVYFPGFLYLDDGLMALQSAWGPVRASLALFGGEALLSVAIVGAFRATLLKQLPTVCQDDERGVVLVAHKGRLRARRLEDGAPLWSARVKQPLCALGAKGALVLHDVPGDFVVVRATEDGRVRATLGPLKAPLSAGTVSRDGRLVAILDEDGFVSLWTTDEGQRLWEVDTGFGDDGLGIAFAAPDDARLLASSRKNGGIATLDPGTGALLDRFDSAAWVEGDAFTQTRPHPGGDAWTVETMYTAWAFGGAPEAPTPGPRGSLPPQEDGARSIITIARTNATGTRLAVADDRRCAVYEGKSSLVAQRAFDKGTVRALSLSDDGSRVLIAGRRGVLCWDLRSDTLRELG